MSPSLLLDLLELNVLALYEQASNSCPRVSRGMEFVPECSYCIPKGIHITTGTQRLQTHTP